MCSMSNKATHPLACVTLFPMDCFVCASELELSFFSYGHGSMAPFADESQCRRLPVFPPQPYRVIFALGKIDPLYCLSAS